MTRPPSEPAASQAAPGAADPAAKAAGVRSLIQGNRAKALAENSPARPAKMSIPRWYLFGGDLLLVALALLTVYKSPTPLDWKEKLFCTLVVVLGACLGIIAICGGESAREGNRSKTSPFANGRGE